MSVMAGIQKQHPRELRAVSGGQIGLGFGDMISKHEKYKKQALNVEELKNPVLTNMSSGSSGSSNSSYKTVSDPQKVKTIASKTSIPSHISKFDIGDFRAAEMRGGGRRKQKGDSSTKVEVIEKTGDIREAVKTEEEGGKKKAGGRWSSVYDENEGSYYYVDNNTHETTWRKPDDFDE